MATNLKGFITDSKGNVILPMTRGELIFDALGNLAFHSEVFKAVAATRKLDGSTTGGKYGLMTPYDLLDLQEAKSRLTEIEKSLGGEGGDTSIASLIVAIKTKLDALDLEVGDPLHTDANNQLVAASGIYSYIDSRIATHLNSVNALRFKGTVGEGGTVTALPTFGIESGDMYKVVSAYSYDSSKVAKPGDIFIAITSGRITTWELIPSGDDVETLLLVAGTTITGRVTIEGGAGVSIAYNSETNKIIISANIGLIAGNVQTLSEALATLTSRVDGHDTSIGLLNKKVNTDSVKTWADLSETVIDPNSGQSTGELKNGNELVTASAVYEVVQGINIYSQKHLTAIVLPLDAALTEDQTGYVASSHLTYLGGTITN